MVAVARKLRRMVRTLNNSPLRVARAARNGAHEGFLSMWSGRSVKLLATSVSLTLALAAATPALAKGDPRGALEEREARVKKVLTDPVMPDAQKKEIVAKEVTGAFDFDELARRSLSVHWDKLTSSQRVEFTGTLQQLVQHSVLEKIRPNKEYSVAVETPKVKGTEAELATMLATPSTLPGDEVELEFRLYENPRSGWLIYDLIIDEVSLLNNYRLQFNKVIREQSFEGLLTQMKRRLASTHD